ncbi:MAG TPA: hypothetical protein VMZ91_08025, partial [Candidatus Paceibacterota bacterium]|nr:hypothetical protein [Candidatus Paceibacterota bacterium]
MIFVLIVLLVPLVTAVGILISPWWPFIKIVNRKKFACLITIGVLASAFTCFFFYLGATRNLYSKEVWNFKITSITHEEKWTEEEMRTRQVATGTDSKGDTTYTTEIYYVTESYGPYWKKYDEYDDVSYISQETYNRWKNKWKNEKRIGIHKGSAAGWDKAISGQIFQCDWPRTLLTIYPNQKITKYKNKVRASRTSIFKLPKP